MNSKKILAGLIGQDIQGSGSPRIHQQEAAALGLDLTYQLADFKSPERSDAFLNSMLEAMETLHFRGTNITHPFKELAFPLVHTLSEEAKLIGSINTIVFKDGKRHGDNTDWVGFGENLKASIPGARLNKVGQIGTGGAGLAVAFSALRLGVKELHLYDSRTEKAEALVQQLRRNFPGRQIEAAPSAAAALAGADGLIQATPVGMLGHPGIPVDLNLLRPEMWVADIIYFPLETELVKAAKRKGCQAIGGGGMAVRQAAASFSQFFGVKPDIQRMLDQFEEDHR